MAHLISLVFGSLCSARSHVNRVDEIQYLFISFFIYLFTYLFGKHKYKFTNTSLQIQIFKKNMFAGGLQKTKMRIKSDHAKFFCKSDDDNFSARKTVHQ